jgi:excisionase family DNA binding protein
MQLLTVRQAARRLAVSERTFRRMLASGEFPQPVRRNRRWVRVPAQHVEEYLSNLLASAATASKHNLQPQPRV